MWKILNVTFNSTDSQQLYNKLKSVKLKITFDQHHDAPRAFEFADHVLHRCGSDDLCPLSFVVEELCDLYQNKKTFFYSKH